MAPYTSYFNYLPTGLAHKARRAYNTVVGADFNRDVAEENQRHATRLEHHDLEVNEDIDPEEEWTGISQTLVRGGTMLDSDDEALTIAGYHHPRPRKLSFTLSEKAAEAACEAAGVSREYLSTALKFLAVDVSRDIGWVMHCKTASDAVKAVKKKFPLLEDMQRAFEEGSGRRSGEGEEVTRARSGSQPVYYPELHAGVEMVPVVAASEMGPYRYDADEEEDEVDAESVDEDGFRKAL